MIQIRFVDGMLRLPVRVTPKGGRDEILPFQDGDTEIRLKVSAPPEDGKANAAVEKLLAKALGLPKSRIAVVHGEKSRNKQVAVAVSSMQEASPFLERLATYLGQSGEIWSQLG